MTEWMTTKQAAKYMNVHPDTVRRYVREGCLRSFKRTPRSRHRFRREWLDDFYCRPRYTPEKVKMPAVMSNQLLAQAAGRAKRRHG